MRFFKRKKRTTVYRQAATKYRLKRKSDHIVRDIVTASLSLSVIAVLSAVLIYSTNFVLSSPYLQTGEVTVRGCKELTEKDVLALASIEPSQNLLVVKVADVEKRIKSNPWVKQVSVGREYPDRVVIEIHERKPVALLKQEAAFYLLDMEGVMFKKLETNDEMDLPILTGFYNNGKMDRPLLDKTLVLLQYLAAAKDFPNIKTVSEIHGHERLGLSLFTNTGLCLLLGFDNYDNKFKRLPMIMADLDRRNQKTGFMQIDLSDPVKVTVQQRNILVPSETAPPKARFKT